MKNRFRESFVTGVGALLVASASPIRAAEFSIQPDGSGDYPTIQAAVDAAAALDEIVLEDGVFTGAGNRDVRFDGKDVVVRSRNGTATCTLDTQGSSADPHRAFRLDAGETAASRIDGLTITGGFVKGNFPENGGGGILVAYGSHPTITNCVFDANTTGTEGFGAGLLAWEDCDITLTDCVFVNGVSGWYGGGFVLRKLCDATVERVVVDNCYAMHGGGGVSITNSNAIVTDCAFSNNWVDEAGGGGMLVKAGAQPIFTRCVFAGNRAWTGAGIGLGNDPNVTLVDCLFEGNEAFGTGGGAASLGPACLMSITGCTFVANGGVSTGQHLAISPGASCTVRNSIFHGGCGGTVPILVSGSGMLDIDCSCVEGGAGGHFRELRDLRVREPRRGPDVLSARCLRHPPLALGGLPGPGRIPRRRRPRMWPHRGLFRRMRVDGRSRRPGGPVLERGQEPLSGR